MKKRTDSEIINDIKGVYCKLSPENLSCDGELSMSETRKREKGLVIRLNELIIELGRVVTESEAFSIKPLIKGQPSQKDLESKV